MLRISKSILVAAPLLALGASVALADDAPPARETPTTGTTTPNQGPSRTPGQFVDDGAITAKVKSQLIGDPATKARHMDVDTRQGIVTLKGRVDSADERVRAVDIARNTRGVKSVDDELTVGR